MALDDQPGSPRWPRWSWALLLALITFAVWAPLLSNEFTLDDVIVVLHNDRLRTWRVAAEVWVHPYNWAANPGVVGSLGTYRPFELVSYVLDYKLFGLAPFGYHLTRLLLHVGVEVLVFLFLCRWVRDVRVAFAAGLIAALHPACAEAMKAPSDLFVAGFGMAAIVLASTYFARPRPLSLAVLFLATLAAKETGIVYVLAALAFAELDRRRRQPSPVSSSLLPVAGAAGAAIAAYAAIRVHALAGQAVPQHGSLARLIDAAAGVWYFATQAFFVPLYRAPAILDFAQPRADRLLWYAVLAGNLVVLGLLLRGRRWLEAVGFSWWLLSLIPPAAATLTPGVWPGLNRWLYAGTPGLLLTLMAIPLPLGERSRSAAWASLCLLLAVLAVRAGRVWKDDVTLFGAMVAESPDHFWSYRRLGWALYYRARFAEAVPVLARGAELAPADERDSCFGMQAAALAGTGDCDGAVGLYRAHLPTPMMGVGHFLDVAAACYARRGDHQRALELWRACGTMDRRCPEAAEKAARGAPELSTPL
jgi:hypothetical protein